MLIETTQENKWCLILSTGFGKVNEYDWQTDEQNKHTYSETDTGQTMLG